MNGKQLSDLVFNTAVNCSSDTIIGLIKKYNAQLEGPTTQDQRNRLNNKICELNSQFKKLKNDFTKD